MIYRIHQDDRYLAFEIPSQEVIDKLGRSYPFHIDRSPVAYKNIWQKPLHIKFRPPESFTKPIVPDISEVDGKLFLSEQAYETLHVALSQYGEFLPVSFDERTGYIFNILSVAERIGGLDEVVASYDAYDNLVHFGFKDEIMDAVTVFRSEIDSYQGIFCNQDLKDLIEKNELSGVFFHTDLANPIGESYGTHQ